MAFVELLDAGTRNAEILKPRECLVARLWIVLKRVPRFANFVENFQGDDERKCMAGLKASPEYQEYLKIAGSFAFFMDLSRYFFLGQILKDCHDPGSLIEKELNKNMDMIWNPETFVNRYGEDTTDLCFELQKGKAQLK